MTFIQIIVLIVAGIIIYLLLYRSQSQKPSDMTANQAPVAPTATDIQNLEVSPLYNDLSYPMMECVADNYQSCDLLRPSNKANHFAPFGERVIWDERLGVVFCYVFNRVPIGHGGMKIKYSAISVDDMADVLNQTIQNYTIQYGYDGMSIVKQGNLPHGRVYFCFAPFGNVNGWKVYLAELQSNSFLYTI